MSPDRGAEVNGSPRRPHRNRVTPLGDLVATGLRGSWLGNRGILHRGTDIVSFHRSNLWIICALQYKDWRAPQWQPGHYTVLFFHDEALALAAGHRPCALCRRPAYRMYRELSGGSPTAGELDRRLHAERLIARSHQRRLHPTDWTEIPCGAYVLLTEGPALVLDDAIVSWTPDGYTGAQPRPRGGVARMITPPSSALALRAGYPVQIDAAATALAGR
jgi:hypothetical protein